MLTLLLCFLLLISYFASLPLTDFLSMGKRAVLNVSQDGPSENEEMARIKTNVRKDERPPSDPAIACVKENLKDKCNQLHSQDELQHQETLPSAQKGRSCVKADKTVEMAGSWQDNLQSNVVCLTIRKHCKNFRINHSARRSSLNVSTSSPSSKISSSNPATTDGQENSELCSKLSTNIEQNLKGTNIARIDDTVAMSDVNNVEKCTTLPSITPLEDISWLSIPLHSKHENNHDYGCNYDQFSEPDRNLAGISRQVDVDNDVVLRSRH